MDLGTLALTTFNLIKPVILNDVAGKIIGDFKEATKNSILELWEKVKPLFIKTVEDKQEKDKAIENLEKNPDDKIAEEMIINKLKTELYNDNNLFKELANIIEKINENADKQNNATITNSKNVIIGNINGVQGNVSIGDNINTNK